MSNVTIEFKDGVFKLLDVNKTVLFDSDDWEEIEAYADSESLNIQYQPKDLIFTFDEDTDDFFIVVDSKYQEGKDNLTGRNVINLPSCIDPVEEADCLFLILDNKSKEEVKKELESLGAKYKEWE